MLLDDTGKGPGWNLYPLALLLIKCPYCDFNVHIRPQVDQARWRAAYGRALEHYAAVLPERKNCIGFFGGGTPSCQEPETIRFVLDKIRALWPCASGMEVTLEANPTSRLKRIS
ncbi:MAG: hypothetical protein R3D66_06040 [Alphaproteobacteria bacterium]